MDAKPVTKVWVVIFFDGFGGMSHFFGFTYDSDMKAIEAWAKEKLAAERASFPKGAATGNKSLPERYVVEGVEVGRVNINPKYHPSDCPGC